MEMDAIMDRDDLAALALVLHFVYRVFHNQSQKIKNSNNLPPNQYSGFTDYWQSNIANQHLSDLKHTVSTLVWQRQQYGVTKERQSHLLWTY